MSVKLTDEVLASALKRADTNFLRQYYELFLVSEIGINRALHLEALYQSSLMFLASDEYKEAFQCAFYLKEIAGELKKTRELIVTLIQKFIEKERGYLTAQELDFLIDEVSTQHSFLKIQGYNTEVIQKYSGLLYYLKTVKGKVDKRIQEGKHHLLFEYLGDLFLISNSDEEAWDRAALKVINSQRI